MSTTQHHHSTCPLCEATCGILVETQGPDIVRIRGDKDDAASRGFVCPKVMGLVDLHTDEDRLRGAQKRVGDQFVDISWRQAFDEIGERVAAIRSQHGADAIGVYQGNPTVHNLGLLTFGQLLFRNLGTRNMFSATSTDQLPHMLAGLQMFGNQLLMPVPDIDRTDLMVIVGGNPVVSGGSLMTAPGFARRAGELQERGGKLVVIDPRRSETADIADHHLPVRPGTDAFLLLAMIDTVISEGLERAGRLEALLAGKAELAHAAAEFPAERVAAVVGLEADVIRGLARDLAQTERAVVYGRIGACQQRFGGVVTWLINALNILCGNLDEVGGAMFAKPAVDLIAAARLLKLTGSYNTYRSRVSDLPEFGGELPVAALAEEIETPGDRQIRALFTSAGNPVLSAPNGPRIDRALGSLELMVSLDYYVNETSRHADYILPPSSPLERDHYDLAFGAFMVRNHAKYSRAVFDKPSGSLHDWEICHELSRRLLGRGWRKLFTGPALALAGRGGPKAIVAAGLAAGPYRLRIRDIDTHGRDLGALEPRLPGLLGRRNRSIDLAPALYLGDLGRLADDFASRSRGASGLVLIGRRQLRSNNSWMHNCRRLVKGKPRCTVLMHPADAAARGLEDGDLARITTRVGSIELPTEICDTMLAGVVSVPHGWGHDRDGTQLGVASKVPGVSVNDITDEGAVDPISGNAAFNGIAVEVAAALAEADQVA